MLGNIDEVGERPYIYRRGEIGEFILSWSMAVANRQLSLVGRAVARAFVDTWTWTTLSSVW